MRLKKKFLSIIFFALSFKAISAEVISSFANVSKKVLPGTVGVTSYSSTSINSYNNPLEELFGDSFFKRYFGVPENVEKKKEPTKIGEASGFIVSKNGYVLTNRHVVDKAEKVTVTLVDGKELDADVIYKAEHVDVAFLKIKSNESFNFLPLADSDKVETGDISLAFGNPYGFSNTMTFGIISATERNRNELLKMGLPALIQTSTPIYEGSSGGPLTNVNGEVIGINSVIVSKSRVNAGYIGFAIPINIIKPVLNSIISNGRFRRGYIGIIPEQKNEPNVTGAVIAEVTKNLPAYKAGIKKGDIIVSINDKPVENALHVVSYLSLIPAGETLKIGIKSGNKFKEYKIKLVENTQDSETKFAFQGITVSDISEAVANMLDLANLQGVIIENLENVRAYSNILSAGDIITEIDNTKVKNVKEFVELYNRIPQNKTFLLTITKKDKKQIVYIELTKK